MNHHSTWGHAPSKQEQRKRRARQNIILITALLSSIVFASFLTTAWGIENYISANPACPTVAC